MIVHIFTVIDGGMFDLEAARIVMTLQSAQSARDHILKHSTRSAGAG
jgi:hypothetical protein